MPITFFVVMCYNIKHKGVRVLFKVGSVVMYGSQGICKIDSIESKQIGKQTADYYVLKPLFNQSAALFVPVYNQALTAKMIDVLSVEEAKKLIKKAPDLPIVSFDGENQKREQYKLILASGKREDIASLIKTIRLEKETRRAIGKKLNLIDEQTLRKAELLFFNELAFVLSVTTAEANEMIKF